MSPYVPVSWPSVDVNDYITWHSIGKLIINLFNYYFDHAIRWNGSKRHPAAGTRETSPYDGTIFKASHVLKWDILGPLNLKYMKKSPMIYDLKYS